MAIDNRLQVFNEEGQSVDYDILASDVKFLPDGKDLPTKLAEMEQEIEEAGSGDGTVTGVKVGSTTHEPTEGVVDLSEPFNDKVDKETGKELIPSTDLAKLQNLPTADQLAQQLGTKANDNAVVKSISVNNVAQQKDGNGNVNLQVQAGEQVSVIQPDPADGTFIIRVGSTDYTINLNHTHEGMAKLVKCTEATLPQTMADDTIYVQVDNLTTPSEIEALHIFGLEFAGGGLPAGTPAITKPSGTSINLGENSGSGVSKAIEIKANSHITGDLTVGLAANSDLSFDTTNLPSGVTYNSGAGTLTIAQATAMQGVNITVVYSGSGAAEIDGGLVISGGGATPKSVVVVVVPQPIGVKLTGTQWLQTDYYPNANTEFELRCKFTDKGNTSLNNGYFLTCANNTDSSEKFQIAFGQNKYYLWWTVKNELNAGLNFTAAADQANFVLDNSILSWTKTSSNAGVFKFAPAGDESKAKSVSSIPMTYTMQNPLRIGRGNTYYFELFELTIYELTITENGTAVRHYVPKIVNGVVGLYDTENNSFISSETAKTSGLATDELEAVYAQNNN